MMATSDGKPNMQADHDMAADGYMGDEDNLIENGKAVVQESSPESPTSYGEVAPLQLDPPKDPKKGSDGLKVIIVSCVVFAIGVTVALIVTIYCAPPQVAPHGAVSCDDERCSNIGADVLKKGGSPVDSAISVMFCLSVVQAESSGIGGGGFMIYRSHKQNKTTTYNFRETAPQDTDTDILAQDDRTSNRGNFVGVPGYLKGLATAYNAHGSLSWSSLIKPSVDLAREGFTVSKNMAYKLDNYLDCAQDDENLVNVYCKQDGTVYKEGETIKLETYGALLDRVANEGADILYSGDLAQEILDTVNAEGGHMTMDDISSYETIEGEPVLTTFQNMTVESVGAPAGGPLLLFALNLLEQYNLKPKDSDSSLYYHRFIETMNFANAIYEYLGDPAVNQDITEHVSKIIDPEFAKSMVPKINDTTTHDAEYYVKATGLFGEGEGQRRRRRATHTTHVSVIGPNEDHVAITCSLNDNFGSKLYTPSGILLNDQLSDFSDVATSSNYFRPGGRPLSHITPTVAHSRDKPCGLRLATGAVGGWSITSALTQSLVNLLSFGLDLKESIEAPSVVYEWNSNGGRYIAVEGFKASLLSDINHMWNHSVAILPAMKDRVVVNLVLKVNETVSEGFSSAILGDLTSTMGHTVVAQSNGSHSIINTVMKVNETVSAHANSNRDGKAVVF